MSNVTNRSELLFLYDVKYANPNGDPNDMNRPRLDEESMKCLVTDVRLKRTIRDYLLEKGYASDGALGDIFIRDTEDGKPQTGDERGQAYKNLEDFISKFIDVRLFGGVSAVKGKKFNVTGPVQFGMGKSLHSVKENYMKGTGAFATKTGAEQKTFREEYNITYGLIGFHGIINEKAAAHTGLTNEDVAELLEGMWLGTKDLNTRSKKGHMPRLLLKVDYENGFYIGDLLERLSLVHEKEESHLEDVADYSINTAALNEVLTKYKSKIVSMSVKVDDRVILTEAISGATDLVIE